MLVFVDTQQAGTDICIKDVAGTEIVSLTAEKKYSSVIISSPDIKEGETYTLTAGTYSEDVTMDTLLVGASGMGGGMMPGHGGSIPQMPDGEPPQTPDGEMPQMPDGEMLQTPDGEPPQKPDGSMPQTPDGEPPQKPDGSMSQMPDRDVSDR